MPSVVRDASPASDASDGAPPKFRWWWSESSDVLETPPDPRLWFVKQDLRCQYAAALERSQTNSAATCAAHCAATPGCVKWSFNNDWSWSAQRVRDDEPNCWLFATDNSSDRDAGPACGITTASVGFTTGVRRPANVETGATCAARCEGHGAAAVDPVSQAPLAASRQPSVETEEAASVHEASQSPDVPACRCDAACARHLDCCLDYVEECAAPEAQLPSCAGRCYEGLGVPIPGGGYCWCDEGCDNTFTDNNSLGSCCADFTWKCLEGAADPLCLDARTQTQALHLFVAHHVLQALPDTAVKK